MLKAMPNPVMVPCRAKTLVLTSSTAEKMSMAKSMTVSPREPIRVESSV